MSINNLEDKEIQEKIYEIQEKIKNKIISAGKRGFDGE
ncbi:MAG: hypothetical protein RLZ35_1160, partial [Pseudomonadota bacterium]